MAEKEEEVIVDVEEVYSKTEEYVNENKNTISTVAGAIIIIIAAYFGYTQYYLAPLEEEAKTEMFKAEQFFAKDSFNLALNGGGLALGFLDIIDSYGGTKAGNLANYYAGICYLRTGDYESAIEHLEAFDGNDKMVGAVAKGATGDAYAELGELDNALSNYKEAVEHSDNNFTAPIYLMKAGKIAEELDDYSTAKKLYERIKKDFPETTEGQNIDKYLAKVTLLAN